MKKIIICCTFLIFNCISNARSPQLNSDNFINAKKVEIKSSSDKVYSYSQCHILSLKDSKPNMNFSADSVNVPNVNIHMAVGWVNGARVGLRGQISKNISLEISMGIPVENILAGGEREERYSFGINWHENSTTGLIISLLCSNIFQPNKSYLHGIPNDKFLGYLRFSTTAGYLFTFSKNYAAFIRGGLIFFESTSGKVRENSFKITPTLDLGIGWTFNL